MLREVSIKNYKSILDDTIELGRINVFIGANGSGKTNILEALAMVGASKDYDLNVESLYNRGVRVTKPSLTFSSFVGQQQKNKIRVNLKFEIEKKQIDRFSSEAKDNSNDSIKIELSLPEQNHLSTSVFYCDDNDNIYSEWKDENLSGFKDKLNTDMVNSIVNDLLSKEAVREYLDVLLKKEQSNTNALINFDNLYDFVLEKSLPMIEEKVSLKIKDIIPSVRSMQKVVYYEIIDFLIYTINTQALRGISADSRKLPLGINGEGLDILLSDFSKEEFNQLSGYKHLISWLDELVFDEKDELKFKGHKLGRSNSILYFRDKYMRRNNNVFSAENANEGALHILFYLALFISKKTPSLFAIDNIENGLNPRICRTLIKELAQLSKDNNKQALITTHNPAILDGLNLFDEEQRLFVVSRNDAGHTKTERIRLKPDTKEKELKLSEMWMRGYLGGIPNNF